MPRSQSCDIRSIQREHRQYIRSSVTKKRQADGQKQQKFVWRVNDSYSMGDFIGILGGGWDIGTRIIPTHPGEKIPTHPHIINSFCTQTLIKW